MSETAQRAWETAMGMRGYTGSLAEASDRQLLRNLEAEAVEAHNACHDWLVSHPDEAQAPDDLKHELFVAEDAVRVQKKRMADKRYYEALYTEASDT